MSNHDDSFEDECNIQKENSEQKSVSRERLCSSIANISIAKFFNSKARERHEINKSLCFVKRSLDREQSDYSQFLNNFTKDKCTNYKSHFKDSVDPMTKSTAPFNSLPPSEMTTDHPYGQKENNRAHNRATYQHHSFQNLTRNLNMCTDNIIPSKNPAHEDTNPNNFRKSLGMRIPKKREQT
jgi:hypothetical protein